MTMINALKRALAKTVEPVRSWALQAALDGHTVFTINKRQERLGICLQDALDVFALRSKNPAWGKAEYIALATDPDRIVVESGRVWVNAKQASDGSLAIRHGDWIMIKRLS